MANLMIYAKKKGEKRFGAVNLASGQIGVGLVYATLIPDQKLSVLKNRVQMLQHQNPDAAFQIRYAGTSKVLYELKECKKHENAEN